jgi:hypothetical protein
LIPAELRELKVAARSMQDYVEALELFLPPLCDLWEATDRWYAEEGIKESGVGSLEEIRRALEALERL